ncbi:stalk domain-containing protein [Paenibacillus sp. FSL H8-0537]|uniref:copper amine oxidase N-terminal domain-containing protein n=1 Tax=Paenibacillus sp. FSL H8-0537 TaxID=2921399 RepID=UPI00310172C7
MKKSVILAGVVSLSLMATTAFAAPGNQGKNEATIKVEAKGTTVSDSVYGNGKNNGSKGLQNAYGNVKDTPAGDRIAELLKTKYNIDVNADTSLGTLVTTLEQDGELKAAEEVQAEVVSQDPTNIEEYKKLSKIKIKLGNKSVKVYVNGKTLGTDVSPIVESGRTFVPFRAISESLDAVVTYDNVSKTVTVTRDGIVVKLTLGSKIATINGKAVTLEVAGKVKNNKVFVPLRFLSEALNTNVTWDKETSSAIIIDNKTEA